jgi:alanine racemase
MKPVLSWKTKISFLKSVGRGVSVSYGATYRAEKPTVIATLPVGYSHGYRVAFSGQSEVIIRGRRCSVAGRVTMDQTMVDVGHVSKLRRWETVTLIGSEGEASITAEELANIIQSIPYEIVCSIHSRVPRLYIGK